MQEVERANNDEMFITSIHQRESIIHFSDDCKQLHFDYNNMKDNSFALYIDQNVMKRFLTLSYLSAFLNEQQRTISLLSNIIFKIFYYNKIQSFQFADANQSKIST